VLLELKRIKEPPIAAANGTPDRGSTSGLHTRLFGGLRVCRDGTAIAIGNTSATTQLFLYLVTRPGRFVSRDELIELLWRGDDRVPVHRLHVAVSSLRRILDLPGAAESVIESRWESYRVRPGTVTTDCQQFDQAYQRARDSFVAGDSGAAAASLRDALALYQNDFLCDWPYQDWIQTIRTHYVERRVSALLFLAQEANREGAPASASDYARQVLEVDAICERAYRQIMFADYLMGQRATAIRRYQTCVKTLERMVGVGPSAATRRMRDAIHAGEDVPDEPLVGF
jgi:DNA-binding SARP family transcriptional activator